MSQISPVAVITGGTGGLGKAVCKNFLDAGYHVVTTFYSDSELKDLLEYIGEAKSRLDALRIDVTDEASLDELAEKVKQKHGKLNVLLCLVGGFAMGTLGEEASQSFDKMMALNAKSFLLTCNALVPIMKETTKKTDNWGHIVAVAARPALEPTKNIGIYAASKAAVVSLVKTLSLELLANNITVNAIAPSTIDTAANRKAMPKTDFKTWVKPEQIAATLLFLTSTQAESTSGAIIPIYGKA